MSIIYFRSVAAIVLILVVMISSILPAGEAGSFFDYIILPVILLVCLSRLWRPGSTRIPLLFFLLLLSLLPIIVNIFTCSKGELFPIGLLIRSVSLISTLAILTWDHKPSWLRQNRILVSSFLFVFVIAFGSIAAKLSGFSLTFSTPLISSRSFNGDPHVFGPLMSFSCLTSLNFLSLAIRNKCPEENQLLRPKAAAPLILITLLTFALSILSGSRGAILVYITFLFFYLPIFIANFFHIIRISRISRLAVSFTIILLALVSLFLFIFLSQPHQTEDVLYTPTRAFAFLQILSGDDDSRSGTISNTLQIVSRPFDHFLPSCESLEIADNGLAFMLVNYGLCFTLLLLAVLIYLFFRLCSPFAKASILALVIFTIIASEALFVPRFFLLTLMLTFISESFAESRWRYE